MEIKMYLKLLQKRWWVVLALVIVTLIATAYFTLKTEPVYQARATYIVRISAFAEERNVISALNTLTSRTEIAATYAGVANSRFIQDKAAEALGISGKKGLSVRSQMESGTNILEITVEGNDPALVRDYTNAIGAQTVDYVEGLYETYRLELLDEASLPGSPIKPNMMQNLALGGVLGLFLGIGLILFMEYLRVPTENDPVLNILDQRFGIFDMRYFRDRLHQEMSRSRRHKGTLSVALVNIDHRHLLVNVSPQTRLAAMRSVVMAVGKSLRDEDVMASWSDTELAILLPELGGEKAKVAAERILAVVSKVSVDLGTDGRSINLNGAAGVAPFVGQDQATTDILLNRARNALESMKESTYGRVMISSEGSANKAAENKPVEVGEIKSPAIIEEPAHISEQHPLVMETPVAAFPEPEQAHQNQEQAEEVVALPESVDVSEQEEILVMEIPAAESPGAEEAQEEQMEVAVAIQEQVEIPEQIEVPELVHEPEQTEAISVETSVSEHHNRKRSHHPKANGNGNGHGNLELSEQES